MFQKRGLELLVDIKANQELLGRAYEPKGSQFFVKNCKNSEEYEELESSLKDKRQKSLFKVDIISKWYHGTGDKEESKFFTEFLRGLLRSNQI